MIRVSVRSALATRIGLHIRPAPMRAVASARPHNFRGSEGPSAVLNKSDAMTKNMGTADAYRLLVSRVTSAGSRHAPLKPALLGRRVPMDDASAQP